MEEKLRDAINKHLLFINRGHFKHIYFLIKEVSEFTSSDYNKIQSISTLRFKIGEIEYYPKKGNLYISLPDNLIEGIKLISEKYFTCIECTKEYEGDENSIIIITLH